MRYFGMEASTYGVIGTPPSPPQQPVKARKSQPTYSQPRPKSMGYL